MNDARIPNDLPPIAWRGEQSICYDTWLNKYRFANEASYSDTCRRVIGALCADEQSVFTDLAQSAMERREIVPAGRILAGAGTEKRVTLINCFVSPDIQDSLPSVPGQPGAGIMDALSVAAYTQQMGGGIGMNYTTIRPKGAVVQRTASVSSGVIPFMRMWDAMCATLMSAGQRRGAMMGVLGIWHPDIEDFIKAKQERGQLTNFNVSVLVPDVFMAAIANDELWDLGFAVPRSDGEHVMVKQLEDGSDLFVYKRVRARELWDNIISSTYVHAEPGVIFIDRVNEMNNLRYCERLRCSNPCFTGDTKVWTAYGPRAFRELAEVGDSVPVLTQLQNGRLAYRLMEAPRRTGTNATLVEVVLRGEGRRGKSVTSIRCTPSHEFFLKNGKRVKVCDLKPRDRISSCYRSSANQNGYVRLTGTCENPLEHHVAAEYRFGMRAVYPDEHVHHINGIKNDNSPENLEILSSSRHNAIGMLGDDNPMRRFPEKNPFSRPGFAAGKNNGRYRHDIDDYELRRLRDDGFSLSKISKIVGCSAYTVQKRLGELGQNHIVLEVRHLECREDVYCGTVPSTGRFFVYSGEDEGVLVSNCGEQMLPPNGICNLGHTNLAVMVDRPFEKGTGDQMDARFRFDKLKSAVSIMVRLLDNVIEETRWPTDDQREEAKAKRRIGLGFTGLASALQQLCIPYGSEDAIKFTHMVSRLQAETAYKTSIQLAKERGPFPAFRASSFLDTPFIKNMPDEIIAGIDEYGIRNGVLLSIAPTGTTSLVIGNVSSGIEPVFEHKYTRKVRDANGDLGKIFSVYDYGYLRYCEKYELDPADDNDLPDYFVTTESLDVEQHLCMAAAAQENIDSAISKTINCPESMSLDDFMKVYLRAYELGLKGCTTYRPNKDSTRGAVLIKEGVKEEAEDGEAGAERLLSHDKIPMQKIAEGRRYQVRWPHEANAYYIIITDYIDMEGERRPFELFISTKSAVHDEWVKALSLLVTAIFRRERDPSFVVEELKSVFSATGGAWEQKTFVPSLVAAIGATIEEHLKWLGMIEASSKPATLDRCPKCGANAVVVSEGCGTCRACGYSNCG